MSGGVIGPIGMTGAIGAAAIGAAVVIGVTAKAAVDITKLGSVAAYEQMQLAAACTAAVKEAKTHRKQAMSFYQNDSRRTLLVLNQAMGTEIAQLKTKLERKGYRIELEELGSEQEEILLKLIDMDQGSEKRSVHPRLRIPAEIYQSVTALIDPLFSFIPEVDPVFREIKALKDNALAIVTDLSKDATEKSMGLLDLESRVIMRSADFKAHAKTYEYYFSQFSSLLFANEKLSEACGCEKLVLTYDPMNAKAQIEKLSFVNAQLRKRLRDELNQNETFIAANRELARLVVKSVRDTGFDLLGVSEQPYGISAMFSYRSSLLRTTVSRDGMLSMDLVGRTTEDSRQVKVDEDIFCHTDLEKIYRSFEKNGLFMQTDRICNLTADSMLYEDDVDMREYQESRWGEDELLAMHVGPSGGN